MKAHQIVVAMIAINLVLLLLSVAPTTVTPSQNVTPVLRGRVVELVDERGQVRSRLEVEEGGEVVLRLMDESGTIRVKLGASEDGSGLLLLDEATEPGIHMVARRTGSADRPTTTSITLRGADSHPRVITP